MIPGLGERMRERKREDCKGGASSPAHEMAEKPPSRRRWNRVLLAVGVTLILLGLGTLVGLYGYIYYTGRKAKNVQEELFRNWEERPFSPREERPSAGDGIARLVIPRLGLDVIVVELRSIDDSENLKRGPGHIPGTAYPGEEGNCVISGHRTTYGAPFRHIEQLTAGEEVILETAEGRFTYLVYEQRIVSPSDTSVLDQEGEPRVTLTACHPWYSASRRIVVVAKLSGEAESGGAGKDEG